MKSDEDFLQEVYEKARSMKAEEQRIENQGWKDRPLRFVRIQVGGIALAVGILVIALIGIQDNTGGPTDLQVPDPYSVAPADMRSGEQYEDLVQMASDIVMVTGQDHSIELTEVYRGDLSWEEIAPLLKAIDIEIQAGQRAIFFLNENEGILSVTDYYMEQNHLFTNQEGDEFTEDKLEELIE